MGPQTVLLTLAKREAAAEGGDAAGFVGADGEFAKAVPFDCAVGDAFRLPGPTGAQTIAGRVTAVSTPLRGVVRAAFTLRG